MGALRGKHELNFIGKTLRFAFTGASSRKELLTSPAQDGPKKFVIHASEDCHLRQGASDVTATTDDFFLAAGAYASFFVTRGSNAWIAAIGAEGASGNLYITEFSDETSPGDGASGTNVKFD